MLAAGPGTKKPLQLTNRFGRAFIRVLLPGLFLLLRVNQFAIAMVNCWELVQ